MPKQSPKPWHDWRNDMRELAIVVGGVLIALVAQQVVQNWEWTQKVAAAETSMKRELLWDDGPQIYQRAMMHPCITQRLDQIRSAVEAHASRGQIFALTDSFQVLQLTYDVVALQAATTSDVSSHISQDMLEEYMTPYAVMPELGRTAAVEQEHIARLHALSRTGGPLSDAEGMQVLNAVELLRNDNRFMFSGARWSLPQLRNLGPFDTRRMQIMTDIARQNYGDCIKPLRSDFPKNIPVDRDDVVVEQR
ncbi:MAG: hypothetical protein V4499_00670 [Pseudomonadota bacterium]|jgi:hypothetical protein